MSLIIYLIAFLEGFTTLSVEIVALREFTPIIGINSISTSVILGIILLALSYGYYIGGKISAKGKNIETKLIRNLIISGLYYFFITFTVHGVLLENLLSFTGSYFFSVLIASIILFFIPVFLASQTIPLLSELLKGKHSGEKVGKLLFYSTIGSFVGAVGTSSFFFPLIGVYKTGIISPILLMLCALILSTYVYKNTKLQILSAFFLLFFLYFISFYNHNNSNRIFEKANAYHNIEIYDTTENKRIFLLNGSYSSGIDLDTGKSFFKYIREVERKVLELKPRNILVIGAAGFTFPNDISKYDFIENIDVVDVDPSLKNIAEKYFLEDILSEKINFFPEPSRFFINKAKEKEYDLILVDAYSAKNPPTQVLTYEFFSKLLEIGDNIYLNIIMDTKLNSNFKQNLFTTINKAFNKSYYKDVNNRGFTKTNIVITNVHDDTYTMIQENSKEVYNDDKNSIELDLFNIN